MKFYANAGLPDTPKNRAFIAATLVGLFVPSGGAQWGLQGPIALQSGAAAGVPSWAREKLPLLYCGNALVWAPGLGVDVRYRGRGLVPEWRLL